MHADVFTELRLDQQITPRVRVRRWAQAGDRLPAWKASAHDGVEVAWPLRVGMRYRIGRRHWDVGVGQAVLVPAHVEHVTELHHDLQAVSLWLDRDLVREVGAAFDAGEAAPFVIDDATRLARLGQLLLDEAEATDPGRLLAADALAEALCVQLARGVRSTMPATASGVDPRVARAVDHVHAAYAEPLTVEDLAHTAGMSRFHFSRLFREQVGLSPYQFLMKTRVERAADLLRGGRRSVTEAACEVGFYDLGRFSRAFRRQMGQPPSAWASAHAPGHRAGPCPAH